MRPSDPTTLPAWIKATARPNPAPKKLPQFNPKAVIDVLADAMKVTPESFGEGMIGIAGTGAIGMVGPLFHGSKRVFSAFDNAKIGTGFGQQVYGRGHYLTTSRPYAERFHDPLSGALYEVDLPKPDPEDFLDWSTLLREQSPKVQRAMASLGVTPTPPRLSDAQLMGRVKQYLGRPSTAREARRDIGTAASIERVARAHREGPESLRQVLAKERGAVLEGAVGPKGVSDFAETGGWLVDKYRMNRQEPSQMLRQAGLPGIRVRLGAPTQNSPEEFTYVVFDPKEIRIKNRLGQALSESLGIP